jgi:hypothetical protein
MWYSGPRYRKGNSYEPPHYPPVNRHFSPPRPSERRLSSYPPQPRLHPQHYDLHPRWNYHSPRRTVPAPRSSEANRENPATHHTDSSPVSRELPRTSQVRVCRVWHQPSVVRRARCFPYSSRPTQPL